MDRPRISKAQIGYILDQGSPANNIPARHFLVPGIRDVQEQCADKLGAAAKAALDGNESGAMRALTHAGLIAETSVKAKINSNIQPSLAESTLDKRRARGVTRENTLVDSGELRNSVTHVIRSK
jgi:inorganic triphosphatase YgiF